LRAELHATVSGLLSFRDLKTRVTTSSPLLRRNVHRLEKGLSMPERRAVFAQDFIEETVTLYGHLLASESAGAAETKWAHDVLDSYFASVDTSADRISAAHKNWAKLTATCDADACFVPYTFDTLPPADPTADFNGFNALAQRRRSVRWYQDAPLPVDKINAAMQTALQAPSACNRQPFDMYLARSRDKVKKITDMPLGTKGFGSDLPAVIAVVGDLSCYADPRDRHLIYIDAALVAMQFMLALSAMGLASVPINWPDLPDRHQRLRQLLGLAPHQVPIMLIGLGVPDPESKVAYSAKKSVEEVLHYVD